MSLVQVIREVAAELWEHERSGGPTGPELRGLRSRVMDAIKDPGSVVDLAMCVGSECIKAHGIRVATWRGSGPCSIYIVCDECHAERLTAEEREHMVEVFGAAWVRHLGLHELHDGRHSESDGGAS